jgi:hypothetical protein
MLDIIYRGLRARFLAGLIDVNGFYRGLYARVVGILLLVGLGALFLNATGRQGVNILLILPNVLVIAYFGFQPLYLSIIAVTTKAFGSPIEKGIKGWEKFCVHIALFSSLYLLTLGLVPIRENVGAAFLIIGALVVLGLLVWAFKKNAKWYEAYATYLAGIGIIIGILSLMSPAQKINVFGFDPLGSFSVTPQQELAQRILDEDRERRNKAEARNLASKRGAPLTANERAEIRAIANGKGPMAQQGKAALVGEVANYILTSLTKPESLCGFEPGKSYLFTITDGETIQVRHRIGRSLTETNLNGRTIDTNGESLPFADMAKGWALALNGSLPGNKTSADENGCFQVGLNLTPSIARAYEIDGGKHPVKIRLHSGFLSALRTW